MPNAVNGNKNKPAYYRKEIEIKFEDPLTWDFNASRINQCVRYFCKKGGYENDTDWMAIQDDMIGHLIKMESSLREIINKLV